jgi:hypothetical protein
LCASGKTLCAESIFFHNLLQQIVIESFKNLIYTPPSNLFA